MIIGENIMKMKARSGIIIWITALAMLAGTVAFAAAYNEFDGIVSYLLILAVMSVSTVVTGSFILRNHLLVTEQTITVCFGMTTTVFETASVTSMKKVTNLIASSSASAKRIEIRYVKGAEKKVIYVSPKDEQTFIQTLCSYNPKINVIESAGPIKR